MLILHEIDLNALNDLLIIGKTWRHVASQVEQQHNKGNCSCFPFIAGGEAGVGGARISSLVAFNKVYSKLEFYIFITWLLIIGSIDN